MSSTWIISGGTCCPDVFLFWWRSSCPWQEQLWWSRQTWSPPAACLPVCRGSSRNRDLAFLNVLDCWDWSHQGLLYWTITAGGRESTSTLAGFWRPRLIVHVCSLGIRPFHKAITCHPPTLCIYRSLMGPGLGMRDRDGITSIACYIY